MVRGGCIKNIILSLLVSTTVLFSQGSLLLVGGGGEGYHDWSDIPYAWFVAQADSGIIINIDVSATASWYTGYFGLFGADPASQGLQIATRAAANDSATADLLRSASGIFIEGGDQWDYVETWDGTLAEQAIMDVFNAGGVIGGTSAGLAVLGEVDFTAQYGSVIAPEALANPCRLDIALSDNLFPLLPGVLTDSHFHSRGRLGRLIPMLARWEDETGEWLTGLGIADNTAACLEPDGTMSVWGEGSVSVIYTEPDVTNNVDCSSTQALALTSLRMDQLVHGSRYDLYQKVLIDGGGAILPVTPESNAHTYQALTLNGASDSTANLGDYQVTNLTLDQAAWRGNLGLSSGSGSLPGVVIMPRVWDEYDEYENRVIGTLWAIGQHPGLTGLLLDSDATATMDMEGVLTPNGQVWVFDSHQLTHSGFPIDHNTCYGGLIGLRIHILDSGIPFDLEAHHPVSIHPELPLLPEFFLSVSPNPFNPSTTIHYELLESGSVVLKLFNIQGQELATLVDTIARSGEYVYHLNADYLPAGVYVCSLIAGNQTHTRKMVLIK